MGDQRLMERRVHCSQPRGHLDTEADGVTEGSHQEIGISKSNSRAKWSHDMKMFLIRLLKDHDVPGLRTQNAWSKEALTNIVCRINQKFNVSLTVSQVKQKEQDLKKDYRSVKDLLDESGFGWNRERHIVDAPDNVWDSFAARRNSKDALQWRDKTFPYYQELIPLYEGRYAEGRTRHGMDHYANKSKHASILSSHPTQVTDMYHSPSPTMLTHNESDLHFTLDDEVDEANLDSFPHSSTPMQHTQAPSRATQICSEKHGAKRGKTKKRDRDDGFHERYLKLKQEEIDRFAAIEEKKLDDPCSITKCITTIEKLQGLQVGDILMASDIFRSKENRELFLSFSTDDLRLAWIRREIARSQPYHQD